MLANSWLTSFRHDVFKITFSCDLVEKNDKYIDKNATHGMYLNKYYFEF